MNTKTKEKLARPSTPTSTSTSNTAAPLSTPSTVLATARELPVILVFDADLESRAAITHSLANRFRTQGAETVPRALDQWRSTRPALVLIDLVLDGGSGVEILVEIRRTSHVPIIVMAHDDTPQACVLALRLGADDFVVKPFDISVLGARIDAVLRRSAGPQHDVAVGCPDHVEIDVESSQVLVYGTEVHLTRIEFNMLAHLASNPRQVFTREQLLEAVWLSRADWQAGATVTEHMRRLRAKLGPAADHIKTVYGRGYRFDACPAQTAAASARLLTSAP